RRVEVVLPEARLERLAGAADERLALLRLALVDPDPSELEERRREERVRGVAILRRLEGLDRQVELLHGVVELALLAQGAREERARLSDRGVLLAERVPDDRERAS